MWFSFQRPREEQATNFRRWINSITKRRDYIEMSSFIHSVKESLLETERKKPSTSLITLKMCALRM